MANLNPNQIISTLSSVGDPSNISGTLSVSGNVSSTSSSPAVVLNNATTMTSGKLVSIQTGTSEVAGFDYAGHLSLQTGNSSSTAGAATLNTPVGKSKIAASASSVVITNSLVTTSSVVIATINQASADATLTSIVRVVPAAGSFTIYGNATSTAAVTVNWAVFN